MEAGDLVFGCMVLAAPVAIGAAVGRLGRPWWWAGVPIGLLGLLLCATDPDEGFVSGKDDHIPEFFILCTAAMVCLVALGAALGRRRRLA
jgi:hypothetical protein